ncbi:MAG: hypothetical protein JWP75_2239 [Frondihabitans sp.]|nr:hypothetical protein [Frondihabitans sp.]
MTVSLICKRCKELITAEDEDDLFAQVEAHARDHGGARGTHVPSRERILGHLKRGGGDGSKKES